MSFSTALIGDLTTIRTGKLDANAANPGGKYPFFTCAQEPLAIDRYAYDCDAILVAGNGDLNVKHYKGKFEAYQRTYIIEVDNESKLDSRYFYYFMSKYVDKLRELSIGGVIKYIKLGMLTDAEIPLPLLAEQKRIAAILDKADTIRRKRQAAIKLADDFLRATFLDMFGDPLTNSKRWETAPLKEFGDVTTGNTPPRKRAEFYGNDIEWIKSDNINTPNHFLTEAEEGLSELGKKMARIVPTYSILVTCIAGSFDCIGNAALSDREVAFNQQINAITPNKNTDPYFLYALIINAKKIIRNASTNSMKGMVSKGKFEQILFFKPPPSLQQEFGSFFKKHIEKNNNIRTSKRLSCILFNSLTQRAFRGEI